MSSSLDETLVANPNSTVLSVVENNEPENLEIYRNIIQDTVADIFLIVGVEEFSNELKTHSFCKKNPKIGENLHNHIAQSISKHTSQTVEKQIKYDKFEEKFSKLKEIIDSTPVSDTPAWRPSHNVEENIRAYVMQDKIKYQEELKYMVSKKEDAVNKLQFEVSSARSRANAINERLHNLTEQLDCVNEKCRDYVQRKSQCGS